MKFLLFIVVLLTLLKEAESSGRLSQQENEKLRRVCGKVPKFRPEKQNNEVRHGIVGGMPIPGYIAPWSVHLVSAGTNCSGTIISPRHILSASHCVVENPAIRQRVLHKSESKCDSKNKDHVYTGDFDEIKVYISSDQLLHSKIVKLVTLNLCEHYDFWADDFMILELDEDIRYSPFAQPVCTAKDTSYNPSGLKIHMYTYGHNNTELNDNKGVGVLRYGAMQINKLDTRVGPYFSVFDREGRVNMRAGDSGGGAISYEYGSRYVVGVVSHAINGITYFTSVGHHFEQICAHTGVC